MTKFLATGALMLAAWTAAIPDQQMSDLAKTFTVSGPTSFADGKVRGATAGVTDLKPNQTIELFQTAGKSLCLSSSAVRSTPDDAGYGWRLRLTPISATDGLVIDVDWQRLWDRGAAITNGPRGRSRVTLHPGDKIMLDYIAAPGTTAGCDALGMGLQLELGAVESQALVEADLWLVRMRDRQTLEQLTIRTRQGAWNEFFFKDFTQPFGKAFFFFNDPRTKPGEPLQVADRTVRVSGRLLISEITPKGLTASVDLAVLVVDFPVPPKGNAVFQFSAAPTDVVDFRVPQVPDNGRRVGEEFSVRVRLKPIAR